MKIRNFRVVKLNQQYRIGRPQVGALPQSVIYKDVMIRIFLVAITSLVSACHFLMMGDGAMGITGNLGRHSQEACIAKILTKSQKEVLRFDILPDKNSSFTLDFTVAPYDAIYFVEIACDDKFVLVKAVNYPKDLRNGFYLDLGVLPH